MKKLLLFIAALALSFFALTACSPEEEPPPEQTMPPVVVITPTPSPTPTPEPEPTPYDGEVSLLSGLPVSDEKRNARPLAIMINNRQVALPHLGVSKADIIFEIPVEGSITRMLALFQDTTGVGEIGSVRSSRPYYVDIAEGYDAIYIHAGGSDDAYTQLVQRKIARFDGVNGPGASMFYRDAGRRKTMGYEHSMLTSDAKIEEYLPTLNYRLEHEPGYSVPMSFEETCELTGEAAGEIKLTFSSLKSTSFFYREDKSDYYAEQYGKEYKDGNTDELVLFSNVVVLKTAISGIPGDKEGRLTVKLTGSGEGFLAIGGKYIPITWSKDSASEPFVFKDSSGKEVTLRTGHTYVGIMSNSAKVEFS